MGSTNSVSCFDIESCLSISALRLANLFLSWFREQELEFVRRARPYATTNRLPWRHFSPCTPSPRIGVTDFTYSSALFRTLAADCKRHRQCRPPGDQSGFDCARNVNETYLQPPPTKQLSKRRR